jgi:hypothetical protein
MKKLPMKIQSDGLSYILNSCYVAIHKQVKGKKVIYHVLYATGVVAFSTPAMEPMEALQLCSNWLRGRCGKSHTFLASQGNAAPLAYLIEWSD